MISVHKLREFLFLRKTFLGPILAVILLFYFKIPIRNIFYLAVIPGLLAVIMILFVREKPGEFKSKYKLDVNIHNLPKSYWKYLGVTALFGIGNISSSFMILQTRNIGVPLIGTILIYAVFNLIAAAVSFPSGILSDRFGRKNVLLISFFVFLIALVGFSVTHNFVVIAVLFVLYGAYQGIFRTVGKAFAADFVPQELRAGGIGLYNATIGISGLVASITAGQLYDRIGHPVVFLTAAVFVGLGSIFLSLLRIDNKNT